MNFQAQSCILLQWREITDGTCEKKDFSTILLPVYFKLSRQGATFRTCKSADGNQRILLGNVQLKQPFAENYLIGLEVVLHISHMLDLSKFDHVHVQHIAE